MQKKSEQTIDIAECVKKLSKDDLKNIAAGVTTDQSHYEPSDFIKCCYGHSGYSKYCQKGSFKKCSGGSKVKNYDVCYSVDGSVSYPCLEQHWSL